MKLHVDERADALYFRLTDAKIVETDVIGPGIIVDLDEHGEMVGIEMLSLNARFPSIVRTIEFKLL